MNFALIYSADRNAALEGAVGSQVTLNYSRTTDGRILFQVPDRELYVELPKSLGQGFKALLAAGNAPAALLNQKPIQPPPSRNIITFDQFMKDYSGQLGKVLENPVVKTGIRALNTEPVRTVGGATSTAVSVAPPLVRALGATAGTVAGGVATFAVNEAVNTQPTADLNDRTFRRSSVLASQQAQPSYWRESIGRRHGRTPLTGGVLSSDQVAAASNLAAIAYRRFGGNLADRGEPPARAESWILDKAGGGIAGLTEMLWIPYNDLPRLDRSFNREGVTRNSFRAMGMTANEAAYANDVYLRVRNRVNPQTREAYSPQESFAYVQEQYWYGKAWRGMVSGGESRLRQLSEILADRDNPGTRRMRPTQ